MRPIRPDLLIHTITYQSIKKDRWGEETIEEATVNKVRVEPTRIYQQTSTGEKLVSATLIFWDKVHSSPCEFKEGDKIVFEGKEMTIQQISKLYDRTTLHHLEIRVI